MIATTWVVQPTGDSILSNYRQIQFQVLADSLATTDMPMYLDVYVLHITTYVFIKTYTSFTIANDGSGHSIFQFDIQDVMQEIVLPFNNMVIDTPEIILSSSEDNKWCGLTINCSMLYIQVKARGSSISSGLLIPGQGTNYPLIPTQGTATTLPTHGAITVGGFDIISNFFYVLNSTYNLYFATIYENDIISILITNRCHIDFGVPNTSKVYPLSNLPKNDAPAWDLSAINTIYKNTYGYLPILFKSVFGTNTEGYVLQIYFSSGDGTWGHYDLNTHLTPFILFPDPNTYYLPLGLGLIQQMMNTVYGSDTNYNIMTNVDSDAKYFRLVLRRIDSPFTIDFQSTMYQFGTTLLEQVTLQFLNFYGHYEQVTFARSTTKFNVTSGNQFKTYDQALTIPTGQQQQPYSLAGHTRFNIRANDNIGLVGTFTEALMPWLKELMASPKILMESANIAGDLQYVLVVISDDTFVTKKTIIEGRTNYEVSITIRPQLDYIQQRN